MILTVICPKCKRTLPMTKEFFYRRNSRSHYRRSGFTYWCKKCILESNKEYQWTDKQMAIFFYSNGKMCCDLCNENDIDVLTIDHIIPILRNGTTKKKHQTAGNRLYQILRIKNYPIGYRILCRNCNYKEWLKYNDSRKHIGDEKICQHL